MSLLDFFAVVLAVAGVYLLLQQATAKRQVSIIVWRVSATHCVGFVLATAGFFILLVVNSNDPEWWGVIQEKRSESLDSWLTESGHWAVFWLLSMTSIGSAIVVVTARERKSWLDAGIVFGVSMTALFGFLSNGWACAITLAVTGVAGWVRRDLFLNEKHNLESSDVDAVPSTVTEQPVEPLLVSIAGVLMAWLLVVSIHWAVYAEGAPERLRKTDRGLPRVAASQAALVDEHAVESSSANSAAEPNSVVSNDAWLIALSFVFMGLSGAIGVVHTCREPTHEVDGS